MILIINIATYIRTDNEDNKDNIDEDDEYNIIDGYNHFNAKPQRLAFRSPLGGAKGNHDNPLV